MQPFDQDAAVTACVVDLLPDAAILAVERAAEGVSTVVYRVEYRLVHPMPKAKCIGYLRIAPEAQTDLAAEAAVHGALAAAGLRVPAVLAYRRRHPRLDRSVILTSAISGQPIGYTQPPPCTPAVLHAAGGDLARINQVAVRGFGWANRLDPATGAVTAEHASLTAWLHADYAEPLQAAAAGGALLPSSTTLLPHLLTRVERAFADAPPVLAHGDFDPTHIFWQDGAYTGIIDFGEIRGAPRLYDLAHFAVESAVWLPDLLASYQRAAPLSHADLDRLPLLTVLIAARRIGRRCLQHRPPHPPDLAYVNRWLAPR